MEGYGKNVVLIAIGRGPPPSPHHFRYFLTWRQNAAGLRVSRGHSVAGETRFIQIFPRSGLHSLPFLAAVRFGKERAVHGARLFQFP